MYYHGTEAILLNENGVFGDGTHESTQMVLEALYRQDLKGKTVLDVGTGTGIQSIFAKIWGAGKVLAVDVDLNAIQTARKNFQKNNLEIASRMNIYNEMLDIKADATIANLPVHSTIEFISMARDTMAEGGIVIFSWDRQFNLYNEVNLDGYKIVDHLEGIDWDAYVIKEGK